MWKFLIYQCFCIGVCSQGSTSSPILCFRSFVRSNILSQNEASIRMSLRSLEPIFQSLWQKFYWHLVCSCTSTSSILLLRLFFSKYIFIIRKNILMAFTIYNHIYRPRPALDFRGTGESTFLAGPYLWGARGAVLPKNLQTPPKYCQ